MQPKLGGSTPHTTGWVGCRLQTTGWVGQANCVHTVARVCCGGGQMKQRVAGVGICMVSHTTGAVQQCTAWVCGGQMKQWVCTVGVGCMAAAIIF